MEVQHILVPLDFSEPSQQALDYATQLAEKLQARLTLLHVIQTPVLAGGPGLGTDATLVPYMEQMEADMQQKIEGFVQQVRQRGLTCDAAVVHGAPFQQIVDLATDQQVDLIVMGTHGHTGLQHLLLGSVAEKVVRLAPCAVLVTRSPADANTQAAS